jgi:hypothetical protein
MKTFTEQTSQYQKSDCVLFSLYYNGSQVNRSVIDFYIDLLNNYFKDFDIYIGVNGVVDDWLLSRIKNFKFEEVLENIKINSDSCGYITALSILKKSNLKYSSCYFFHTKGSSHKNLDSSIEYRYLMLKDFCCNIKKHRKMFEDNSMIGIIGHEPSIFSVEEHIINSLKIKNDLKLPYQPIGFFYCGTHYIMRGEIVYNIIHKLPDGFFNQNIYELCGFDRYFFEGVFKSIPEMCGYEPVIIREDEYKNGEEIQSNVFVKIENWKKNKEQYKPKIWYD